MKKENLRINRIRNTNEYEIVHTTTETVKAPALAQILKQIEEGISGIRLLERRIDEVFSDAKDD